MRLLDHKLEYMMLKILKKVEEELIKSKNNIINKLKTNTNKYTKA